MEFPIDIDTSFMTDPSPPLPIQTIVNTLPLDDSPFIAPYVPICPHVAHYTLKIASIKPNETLLDLGCGDGRILSLALDSETPPMRAIGVEFDSLLVKHMKDTGCRFDLIQGDIFKVDWISLNADVMILYLLPAGLQKLAPLLRKWFSNGGNRVYTVGYAIPSIKEVYVYETKAVEFMGGTSKTTQKIYLYTIQSFNDTL